MEGGRGGPREQLRIHSSTFHLLHSSSQIPLFSQSCRRSPPTPSVPWPPSTHLGEGLFQPDDVGNTGLRSHQLGVHVETMLPHRQESHALGFTV